VAVVDGQVLPPQELNERYAASIASFASPDGKVSPIAAMSAKLRIVEQLIDETLTDTVAARNSVTVTEAEIDAWLATAQGALADEKHASALRARARHELLVDRLSGAADVVVTDEMIATYYQDNLHSFERRSDTGTTVVPLSEVREQLRSSLGASLRGARRDEFLRYLRATIPWSNELEKRFAPHLPDGAPSRADIIIGAPPSRPDSPPLTSPPLWNGR
jgi:hypothetical protein